MALWVVIGSNQIVLLKVQNHGNEPPPPPNPLPRLLGVIELFLFPELFWLFCVVLRLTKGLFWLAELFRLFWVVFFPKMSCKTGKACCGSACSMRKTLTVWWPFGFSSNSL